MDASLVSQYDAVRKGCGVIDQSARARIWSDGRDRIDLIHRMSTNDLGEMAVNEGRATVLTTAIGRMVDRLIVINLGERALLWGGAGASARIRRWLSGHIFFQDQIKLSDATDELGQFDLFGPRAGAVAEALIPGASGLNRYHVLQRDGLIVGRGDALAGSSFFVVAAKEQMVDHWQSAVAAGAVEADRAVYKVLRIESGLPESDHEIGEGFIPLEAGLWNDVSFTKGCYIGQEIIARMESRGKLAKQLTGVRAAGPLSEGAQFSDGVITSAAESPRLGWIGLAFVKTARAAAGTEIEIDHTKAIIAALPFEAQ
jgi:aminomethyltransferase